MNKKQLYNYWKKTRSCFVGCVIGLAHKCKSNLLQIPLFPYDPITTGLRLCVSVCVRWSRPWESREWISDDIREKANLKALIPLDSLPLRFGSLVCPLHWCWLTAPTPATTGLKGWIKVTEAQWGWTVKQRENKGKKVRKNIEDEDRGKEWAERNILLAYHSCWGSAWASSMTKCQLSPRATVNEEEFMGNIRD